MADDSSGSTFIDEKGRVFGLINIVDLLVIVLLVAVIAAGAALVLGTGEEPSEEEEQYVTLEMNSQPEYIAEEIQEGDQWDPEGGTLTVTDTYMAASSSDDNVDIWIQAKINGTTISNDTEVIALGDTPVRLGERLELNTDRYSAGGTITDISESTAEIDTETRDITVVTDVDQQTADRIAVGDGFTVGDRTWMTVEEIVTRYATASSDTDRLVLGVNTEVRTGENTPQLGHRTVQLGESIPVRIGGDQMTGSIISVDSFEEPGEASDRTVTMQANATEQPAADLVEPGMVETVGDNQFAEVLAVESSEEMVEITVEMSVKEQEDGAVTYRTDTLLLGESVVLQLDSGPVVEWQVTGIDE